MFILSSASCVVIRHKQDRISEIEECYPEEYMFNVDEYEFTYDGNIHKPQVSVDDDFEGMGKITVTYYKDGKQVASPVDVGMYEIKISTEEGSEYYATDEDISLGIFTIKKPK